MVLLRRHVLPGTPRVELPLGTEEPLGRRTVSLSADGQLVLVTVSAAATEQRPLLVPTTPYLIEGY